MVLNSDVFIDNLQLSTSTSILPPLTPAVNNGNPYLAVATTTTIVPYQLAAQTLSLQITTSSPTINFTTNATSITFTGLQSGNNFIAISGLDINGKASVPFYLTIYQDPAVNEAPILDLLPSQVTSPLLDIAGSASASTIKVNLYLNNTFIERQTVINNRFAFTNIMLTSSQNAITVTGINTQGQESLPTKADILFPNFDAYKGNLDLFGLVPINGAWGSWDNIGSFQLITNPPLGIQAISTSSLSINQNFDNPTNGATWGGILWKLIPSWQKDFSIFEEIQYVLKNDGNHPNADVVLALFEESGEVWKQKLPQKMTGSFQTYSVGLNQANFVLDIYNKQVNNQLDLNAINRIAFFFVSNNSTGTQTMEISSITGIRNVNKPVAPIITTQSKTTNIINQTITGNVLDLNIIEVVLYINNNPTPIATTQVANAAFTFTNITLSTANNAINVKALNNLGQLSDFSNTLNITLQDKTLLFSMSNASSISKPIYVILPVGSQTVEEIPTAQQILLQNSPQLGTNLPQGRQFVVADLQIVDVTLANGISKAITIAIPLETNNTYLEAWAYDINSNSWTQNGLSNQQIIQIPVFDASIGAKVDVPYLSFTANSLSIYGVFQKR